MPVQRQVMKFLVPLSVNALGRNDLVGRAIVPFYINPETFKINEKKMISSTLTKGGYSVQYWGEELSTISAGGTTGSGGIEAINILRKIYRNEIHVFNDLLRIRAENSQDDFITAFGTVGNLNRNVTAGQGVGLVIDDILMGSISGFKEGFKSSIEEIADAANEFASANPMSVELVPTLGAFATSVILYFQGEKFQGYFTDFSYDENAAEPGLFTYSFSFTILKRSGVRKNFMPWHRNPLDATGTPVPASLPKEGARVDELSFESQAQITGYQVNPRNPDLTSTRSVTSTIRESQSGTNSLNNVGVSRRNAVKGS